MIPSYTNTFTIEQVGNIANFLKECRRMMGPPDRLTWEFSGNYSKVTLFIYSSKYATWFALRY